MSVMRRKRLEALETLARNRTAFTPGPDPAAVAAALRTALAEIAIVRAGRASLLAIELGPESEWSPAKRASMRNLDRMNERQATTEAEAKQAKRAAKLARRAARRAAQCVEPVPAPARGKRTHASGCGSYCGRAGSARKLAVLAERLAARESHQCAEPESAPEHWQPSEAA
jgi:hypothetical protein